MKTPERPRAIQIKLTGKCFGAHLSPSSESLEERLKRWQAPFEESTITKGPYFTWIPRVRLNYSVSKLFFCFLSALSFMEKNGIRMAKEKGWYVQSYFRIRTCDAAWLLAIFCLRISISGAIKKKPSIKLPQNKIKKKSPYGVMVSAIPALVLPMEFSSAF